MKYELIPFADFNYMLTDNGEIACLVDDERVVYFADAPDSKVIAPIVLEARNMTCAVDAVADTITISSEYFNFSATIPQTACTIRKLSRIVLMPVSFKWQQHTATNAVGIRDAKQHLATYALVAGRKHHPDVYDHICKTLRLCAYTGKVLVNDDGELDYDRLLKDVAIYITMAKITLRLLYGPLTYPKTEIDWDSLPLVSVQFARTVELDNWMRKQGITHRFAETYEGKLQG